jgi:hypothetical protein
MPHQFGMPRAKHWRVGWRLIVQDTPRPVLGEADVRIHPQVPDAPKLHIAVRRRQ